MSAQESFTIKIDRKTRHDLRTPINQIVGYAELLDEEFEERGLGDFRADLGKIRAAALQLMEMFELVFGAIKLDTPAPVDSLPPAADAPAGEAEAADALQDRKGDGSTILIVDDNEANRLILARRLFKSGYKVLDADSGEEALELLNRGEHTDLVLLDILMPGISGVETLQAIRRKFSLAELPVIMATALDRSEDIVQALRLEANDYVTKPLDFPVVLARIHMHLVQRRLMRMKDEFVRIASHDLKNPIVAILGAAQVLAQAMPEQARFTGIIVERTRQMRRIIEDFLDFQALEDGRIKLDMKPLDLNEIAARIFAAHSEYAAGKGIDLKLELAGALPRVHADEMRLDQVASNLVSNAIKFSPPGAEAVIRTRLEGGRVRFEVSDTGPGLKDEDFAKLFLKYARLSNRPTGKERSSGLGLAICKQLIELPGGEIGARNNPSRGASFSFALPPAEAPQA